MVDGQQRKRLDQLGLNCRRADCYHRLLGENGRALRNGPDVACESELLQVGQEVLAEQAPAPEVRNVFLVKVQILDILNQLAQPCADGEASLIRHTAEEYVEIGNLIIQSGLIISVAHGQLVEVAQHGHVQFLFGVHLKTPLFVSVPLIIRTPTKKCNHYFKITVIFCRIFTKVPCEILSRQYLAAREKRFVPSACFRV